MFYDCVLFFVVLELNDDEKKQRSDFYSTVSISVYFTITINIAIFKRKYRSFSHVQFQFHILMERNLQNEKRVFDHLPTSNQSECHTFY